MSRIILPIVLFMLPLAAQTDRAALTGVMLDPSRSVVPSAKVSLHAEATGLNYSSVTNSAGAYTISALPVGQYTAAITAVGFEPLSRFRTSPSKSARRVRSTPRCASEQSAPM